MHIDVSFIREKKASQNVKKMKNIRKTNIHHLKRMVNIHICHKTSSYFLIPTPKTILLCIYQTLYLFSKPLKQINRYLISLSPPLHMLSTTFTLMKHIDNSMKILINFHLNAHAPFVLNHILEDISEIWTKCTTALDASLKQRVIASHYQTTWTLLLSELSFCLFHK